MQQNCALCRKEFHIEPEELDFLQRVSPLVQGKTLTIPPPTLCIDCRVQQRFMHRNERHLYRRSCDLTGEEIITFYAPDAPYRVYGKDAWWSDQWDALSYGRPFDPTRSFFEQFQELRLQVPRLGMVMTQAEGGQYSPYCVNTKNCYMSVSCQESEDCYFCYQTNKSRDCIDCAQSRCCERAYECLYCFQLSDSAFCRDCDNSNGLLCCTDCRGCTDCIGCKNLVNKKNCLFNRQSNPSEIADMREQLRDRQELENLRRQSMTLFLSLPTRASHLVQCENCTGDHLRNCRDCTACFDAGDMELCANVFPIPSGATDCRDAHYSPGAELVFDSVSAVRSQRSRFVLHSWDVDDATYTDECFSSRSLFGCVGLRRKEYCILNRQYAKEQYELLLPKIIAHMEKTGEWGEFFPHEHAPFAYNESIAQEMFPMTEEEATTRKWGWREQRDEPPKVSKIIPASAVPNSVDTIPDEILQWAIECEATKRPFKIIKQELDFYRTQHLPIPRLHPDERHRRRMSLRNPRKLWKRPCMKCAKEMQTTYAPDRSEIVYCEECYLKEVY